MKLCIRLVKIEIVVVNTVGKNNKQSWTLKNVKLRYF